jgi:hypothetical protein
LLSSCPSYLLNSFWKSYKWEFLRTNTRLFITVLQLVYRYNSLTERFLKKLFPALHAQLCLHFFLNPLKPFHTWLLSYEDSYMFTTVLLYMLKEVTTLFDLFINISMGTSCFTLDGNSSQLWMSAHYPYATLHTIILTNLHGVIVLF